jgi:hypothetical protein
MEIDKRLRILFYSLLVIYLLALLSIVLQCTQVPQNKLRTIEPSETSITAIASPIYLETQVYGSYMVIDKDVYVERIIDCESGGEMKLGDLDYKENGVSIPSFGVAQFQLRTFNELKDKAGRPFLDYHSEQDQRWLLKWSLSNGYAYLWTCARALGIS